MVLAPRLELRQGQALVMTPQLQQAIKLLQLSNLELSTYVEGELERNPLLEADEGSDRASAEDGGREDERADGDNAQAGEDAGGETDGGGLDFEAEGDARGAENSIDSDVADVYPDHVPGDAPTQPATPQDSDSGWSSLRTGSGGDGFDFESTLTRERTLADHLSEQLSVAIGDPVARMIGVHLIDMVDETGYLSGDLAQVAERLGVEEPVVAQTLAQMQTAFDPPGILARSFKECLALQLAEKDRLDPAMQCLIDNLELLAKRDTAALLKKCGVDREDLAEMIKEIKQLNPKPGLAFGSVVVQPVVPDVTVREGADGTWLVELNSETLPRVLVNQQYYTTVSRTARSSDEKEYLSECFANANWLVKSLDQRARTILKVAREIVKQQDGFLVHGVQFLKPLNLKTVAAAIDMHESTVSRVTSNKYIATPRGVFEMKYFFTSAIAATGGGDSHSAEAVRHRIKELVDGEAADAILSDDKIVELLRGSGIDIARRTVAKYREALNIPSSVQRRREKSSYA